MPRTRSVVALLQAALLFSVATAGQAAAREAPSSELPRGFFGVVSQGELGANDFARMEGTVGTLRILVYWPQIEPMAGVFDFSHLDALAGDAADHGIELLPFVLATPSWLEADAARPPIGTARARGAWKRFLGVLVSRYGPRGYFWRSRARRARRAPIRRWQIWNEPNFRIFWHPRPAPRQYARLLHLSAVAIRSRDPGAKIVLAGVAPVGAGFLPWIFLRRLYRIPGVKRNFDLVALHPYSVRAGTMVAQIELARRAMVAAGDARTPIMVTELGVASRGDIPSAFVVGEAAQAGYLRRTFELLLEERRHWRIAGIDWFAWRDEARSDPRCGFCQGSGLLRLDRSAKPAWWAYRQTVRAARVR